MENLEPDGLFVLSDADEDTFTPSQSVLDKIAERAGGARLASSMLGVTGNAPQIVTMSESQMRKEQASGGFFSGSFVVGGIPFPKWAVMALAAGAVYVATRKKR